MCVNNVNKYACILDQELTALYEIRKYSSVYSGPMMSHVQRASIAGTGTAGSLTAMHIMQQRLHSAARPVSTDGHIFMLFFA